ncbi:MAG: phosphotransferase family protein [Colwellia sp.]|nr:phosphotransferase family protein [Colwellia sp.]MCW8864438.1 phosphotransferase family protein [Colwellia sp.]MCW9080851.1 phosphotransferase family protein [Colwellia sp.]
MSLIDTPKEIRAGEALDSAALDSYLKKQFSDLQGEIIIKQFPDGASNLTYLIGYENREFILRRPPFGKLAKSAHNMVREARIMQALKPVYGDIPAIFALHEESEQRQQEIMGCDFYLMERVIGIIPRKNLPKELTLNKVQTRQLCTNVIDKLIALHQVDYKKAGLSDLGKGAGYVKRQIESWSKRYQQAITPDAVSFNQVMLWLNEYMPDDIATCIIHNDFRFDNVVLNRDNPLEVIGVLDWEMATLGDPLMDLGNSLAYWVQADDDAFFQALRRQPTHLEGMLTRSEVVDYYLEKTGISCQRFDFYQIYGLFRLAAIVQQLYYRYFHGQTKDARFADFVTVGKYLEQRCLALIAHHTQQVGN